MEDKIVEVVVVLNGNFIPVQIPFSKWESFEKMLIDVKTASMKEPSKYIKFNNATIFGVSIQGWYVREPVVSPTEEVLEFLKKQTSEGDDWKA